MRKKLTAKVRADRKKPGGSNAGKYKGIKEFAGPAGGAPAGTYPINTKKHAESALKLAHNAPNPSGIKNKVYRDFPELRKKHEASLKPKAHSLRGY